MISTYKLLISSSLSSVKQLSRHVQNGIAHRSDVIPPSCRLATMTKTGAYEKEPKSIPLGLVKVLFTVLPGLYIGAAISRKCAAFLEENYIFLAEEVNDDD